MHRIKKIFFPAVIACFLLACHVNGDSHKSTDPQTKSPPLSGPVTRVDASKTIVENLSTDTSYSILQKSLKSTNLFEILSKPGPFTIFAPMNSAFEKLPAGTLDGLMSDRKNDLENILSYHVVAGLLRQNDLTDGEKLRTLAGEEIIVTKRNDELLINGIRVDAPDLAVSNGRMYVINGILFPKRQTPGAY